MDLLDKKLEALAEDGVCVFDNVLDEQQVQRLRQQILLHLSRSGKRYNGGNTRNDALNLVPEIQWIINETLLSELVRAVIGDDAVYVHHSDILHNTFTGWHRDSIAPKDAAADTNFWPAKGEEPYRLYKFAFYLQDHRDDKTALRYQRGSHEESGVQGALTRIYRYFIHGALQPAAGSLAVFDQRVWHNGVTPVLATKLLFKVLPVDWAQKLWALERKLRGIQDRVFIQVAFGASGKFADLHAAEMVARQQQKNGAERYDLDEALVERLAAVGIGSARIDQPQPLSEEARPASEKSPE